MCSFSLSLKSYQASLHLSIYSLLPRDQAGWGRGDPGHLEEIPGEALREKVKTYLERIERGERDLFI